MPYAPIETYQIENSFGIDPETLDLTFVGPNDEFLVVIGRTGVWEINQTTGEIIALEETFTPNSDKIRIDRANNTAVWFIPNSTVRKHTPSGLTPDFPGLSGLSNSIPSFSDLAVSRDVSPPRVFLVGTSGATSYALDVDNYNTVTFPYNNISGFASVVYGGAKRFWFSAVGSPGFPDKLVQRSSLSPFSFPQFEVPAFTKMAIKTEQVGSSFPWIETGILAGIRQQANQVSKLNIYYEDHSFSGDTHSISVSWTTEIINPNDIVIDSEGNIWVVSNNSSGFLTKLDGATGEILDIFSLGSNSTPKGLTISDDGTKLAIADSTNNVVLVFETTEPATPPLPPAERDPFILSWHAPGSKRYETGVDRGVIYFKDGRVVPWNGLTSVEENFGRSSTPVYFDGVKIHETVNIEGFSAQVSAITYPEEFEEVYGNLELRHGVYLGEQPSKTFGFSYRSVIGNEIERDLAGYKIHIIYNAIATPSDVSYASISDDPELTEFSWEFTTTPEYLVGYRPSAHIVVDTTRVSPDLVTILENILYGTQETPPALPSLQEVIVLFSTYDNFINVVDNKDGTWTASTLAEGYINDLGNGVYEILEANIEWINNITYIISPTPDPPTP